MKPCEALDNLRLRFCSGNSTPVATARITREEFDVMCEALSNWTGRVLAMPTRTTYGMWKGLQDAQELAERVSANRHERFLRLGLADTSPPPTADR